MLYTVHRVWRLSDPSPSVLSAGMLSKRLDPSVRGDQTWPDEGDVAGAFRQLLLLAVRLFASPGAWFGLMPKATHYMSIRPLSHECTHPLST